MNTKLTLTIEKDIIIRAKKYAKLKNRSLSDIIENFLKSLTESGDENQVQPLHSLVDSLKGSFTMPEDMDYDEELKKRIEQKYL